MLGLTLLWKFLIQKSSLLNFVQRQVLVIYFRVRSMQGTCFLSDRRRALVSWSKCLAIVSGGRSGPDLLDLTRWPGGLADGLEEGIWRRDRIGAHPGVYKSGRGPGSRLVRCVDLFTRSGHAAGRFKGADSGAGGG